MFELMKFLDMTGYPNLELSSPLSYRNKTMVWNALSKIISTLYVILGCAGLEQQWSWFSVLLCRNVYLFKICSHRSLLNQAYILLFYIAPAVTVFGIGWVFRLVHISLSHSDYNPSLNILKLTWIPFYGKNRIRCLFFKFSLKMVVDQ